MYAYAGSEALNMHTFTAKALFSVFTGFSLMVIAELLKQETPLLIVTFIVIVYGVFVAVVIEIDRLYDEEE